MYTVWTVTSLSSLCILLCSWNRSIPLRLFRSLCKKSYLLVDKLYLLICISSHSFLYTLTEVYKLYSYSLYTILYFLWADHTLICNQPWMYCISIPLWGHISFCERFSVFKGIIYPLIGKSSERSFYSLIDYRSIESKTKKTVHYWTAYAWVFFLLLNISE